MIKPFADDDGTSSIGGLSVENGVERVVISGSVEITRDQAGLKMARDLKRLANGLVTELEAGTPQGIAATPPPAVDEVANPFA